MASSTRERPAGVPAEASFSDKAGLWRLGPENADGELDGDVSYWDDDGVLVSIARKKNGVAHGPAKRFDAAGRVCQTCDYVDGKLHGLRVFEIYDAQQAELFQMGPNVRRAEYRYDEPGLLFGIRFFDEGGVEVDRDGAPVSVPKVLEGLGPIARKGGKWSTGTWNEADDKHGKFTFYDSAGVPEGYETYRDGVLHGPCEYVSADGTVQRRCTYVGGDLKRDETFDAEGGKQAVYTYEGGRLVGIAEQLYPDGGIARRFDFEAGVLQDFAAGGSRLGVRNVPKPRTSGSGPVPGIAGLLEDLPDETAVDALRSRALSPVDLAELVALAFGGDINRDMEQARAARLVVRAHADETFQAVLRDTGLDTAPRLMTAARVRRLIADLAACASVDVPALERALPKYGGFGSVVVLDEPSELAVELLEGRLTRNGERLRLSGLALTRLPPALRYLTDLRDLEAESNAIASIPVEIIELLRLSSLGLSNNRIAKVPPEIARLRELRRLMLSRNGLARVPDEILAIDTLRVLDLGHNALTAVPQDIGRLQAMDTLWLNDNPLRDLPASMAAMSDLRFLHLGGVAWERPPPVLFELASLETLWLGSASLTELPEDIGRLHRLKELVIWHSQLTALPKALLDMTHLTEIRVRGNPLPDGTLDALKEALPDCTIY